MSHYYSSKHYGLQKEFDEEGKGENRICGDSIVIRAAFKNEIVKKLSFESEGCVISKSSTSFLLDVLEGEKREKARQIAPSYILEEFFRGALTPQRVHCALLPLEVLKKIL